MPYNPTYQQRVTEAASILLKESGGKMSYMKLIKLLYLADRQAFKDWEHPITYDTYASLPMGPVLSSTLNLAKGLSPDKNIWDQYIELDNKDVKIKGEYPKIRKLSPADVKLLQKIYAEFGKFDQFQLAKISEKLPEWKNPGSTSFPIELHELLKVLEYSDEEIERISLEIQDRSALDSIFS
jgi:uncharacterized phage-associated protein